MPDRVLQRYVDRVIAAATAAPVVRRRLLSVMNMVDGPEMLLHPPVVAGVIRHAIGLTVRPAPLWPERRKHVGAALDADNRALA